MTHKCPYCEEEYADAVATVTVEVSVPITACEHRGKPDYDMEASDLDIADIVNEQVATEVDAGNIVWHCSECDHELTQEEAMAMVKGEPEEGE